MELPGVVRSAVCPEDGVLVCPLGAARELLPRVDFLEVPQDGVPRDGSVYGSLPGKEVYSQVCATFRSARLAELKFELDVTTEQLEPFAHEIAAHWGLTLKRKGKGRRFSASRVLVGAVPGSLKVEARQLDTGGDPLFRLTVIAAVDDPNALLCEVPSVPLDALAPLLATDAHWLATLAAHLQSGARSLVPTELRDALMKLPRQELQERTRGLLVLVDRHLHAERTAFEDALEGLMAERGGWLRIRPALRLRLTNALAGRGLRAPVVKRIADALDFEAADALRELIAVSAKLRAEDPAHALGVTSDDVRVGDSDAQQDAVFAVLTAGLSPSDVTRSGKGDWVEAKVAARALAHFVGPPPEFTSAQVLTWAGQRAEAEPSWGHASVHRAQLLAQARRVDSAVFFELLERWSFDEAAVFLISDQSVLAPKAASYRLGARVLRYRKSPQGKRLVSAADFDDERSARQRLEGKKKA